MLVDRKLQLLGKRREETGTLQICIRNTFTNVRPLDFLDYLKLLTRITSLRTLPRVSASCLPSDDQEKSKIIPVSKFVSCFAGPPANFRSQIFPTPFVVCVYSIPCPDGAHRGFPAVVGHAS